MLAQAEESAPLLVGQSPRIRNVLRMVEKLGRCRWPVLLLGETGTGKEVVARSIHKVQPVGPFVTIDCSSLVGPLMESELFGHVKGAFTGAIADKPGRFLTADQGTLFLDELGELPLDLQPKLLRALSERHVKRVGGTTFEPIDGWTVAKIVATWKKYTAGRISDIELENFVSSNNSIEQPAAGTNGKTDRAPIWHREYWDRYIRDEAHLQQTISYIHSNPVKAGLVGSAENWHWSSAHSENTTTR